MFKTPVMEATLEQNLTWRSQVSVPKSFFRQSYSNVSKTKIPKLAKYHFQRPIYSNSNVSKTKIPKIAK